jgi:hypothetical protein
MSLRQQGFRNSTVNGDLNKMTSTTGALGAIRMRQAASEAALHPLSKTQIEKRKTF